MTTQSIGLMALLIGDWILPTPNFFGGQTGYKGKNLLFTRKHRVAKDFKGPAILDTSFGYQVCYAQLRLPPSTATLKVTVSTK